ncbi:MAG TPA: HAD-IA family hydrolase [Anaerolineae bacterium]
MNIAAILFDLGDVIMQEETEVRDEDGNTLSAELVPGIDETLRGINRRGYKLGLVADTRSKTAWNVLHQHHLYGLFDAFAISEEVGCEKPDPRIFHAALNALKIAPGDYAHVVMVGNNRIRDIRGANQLGLVSVWFHWNERYLADPNFVDVPTYEVSRTRELDALIGQIEVSLELSNGRKLKN